MENPGAARKLASVAAWSGGTVSALVGTTGALLWAEATLARKTIGILTEDKPPDATGWYGRGLRRLPGRGDAGRLSREWPGGAG